MCLQLKDILLISASRPGLKLLYKYGKRFDRSFSYFGNVIFNPKWNSAYVYFFQFVLFRVLFWIFKKRFHIFIKIESNLIANHLVFILKWSLWTWRFERMFSILNLWIHFELWRFLSNSSVNLVKLELIRIFWSEERWTLSISHLR